MGKQQKNDDDSRFHFPQRRIHFYTVINNVRKRISRINKKRHRYYLHFVCLDVLHAGACVCVCWLVDAFELTNHRFVRRIIEDTRDRNKKCKI